ncbi:lamin tail domain-containing protein [Shivajiella indica]|uniref:Lamin tail domain-containing protein n=1 Tax=Shivajiella indica TaxID=872115 RepID=A0ABW5B482_9BACT
MKPRFLVRVSIAFSLLGCFFNRNTVYGQFQDFESNFTIVNHPEAFLPEWSANEVRNTAARVFQANGEGRFGSRALGVQPISSFTGEIFTKLNPANYADPKIAFFAKSRQNGSGNRPAVVEIWFSQSGYETFSHQVPVGNESTFPNQNLEYRLFEIAIPEDFRDLEELFIKIEVKYGPGTGSSARFFMDEFGIYDGKEIVDPIKIKKAQILSPFSLELVFDKEIEEANPSQVNISDISNILVKHPTDTSLYIFSEQAFEESNILFTLENLKDKAGQVTPELKVEIENSHIGLGELILISSKTILVSFSQPFLESSISQTSHFLVNGKQPISIDIMENKFQVQLDFEEDFQLGSVLVLEANNIQNAKGEFTEATLIKSFFYRDFIENHYLTNQDELMIFHKIELDPSSITPESFSIEDAPSIQFEIQFPQPTQIVLKSNELFEEGPVYSIQIPSMLSKRGFPVHASKREFVWDRTPPELVNVLPVEENKTLLVFSESLDRVYASITSIYSIDGIHPSDLLFQTNDSQLILTWPFAFESEKTYSLRIEKAVDLYGNFLEHYSFDFQFEALPQIAFKEIVINEVMAAPRASNSLPNAEYVELYNTGERPIYLGGFQLANSRRETTLPSAVLEPKSYLILVPRASAHEFEKYGEVIGLTNWPTLLNSSDQVKLKDTKGMVIDSLEYSTASYGGSAFAQGGYSLEISNPYLTCYLPTNLKTSQDEKRGTPGKMNSVYELTPDLTAPRFLNSIMVGSNKVKLSFSKILNQNIQNVSWSFKPNLSLLKSYIDENPSDIILEFADDLKEGVKYFVTINNLRDCSGNMLDKQEEIWFVMPLPAKEGDLIINEVLFNPRTNAPKFVEIYNRTEKYINLKDWKLANLNSNGEIANRRTLFSEDFILEPYSFLVFTTDSEKLKQEYPKSKESRFFTFSSLPSYPISSGNVIFLNPDESLEERLSYSERMHHPLLRERRGVSLERISPRSPIDDPNNWQSASASEGFATPGYRNSQAFEGQEKIGIDIHPKVFAPDMPGQSAFVTISYKMEQSGKNASMRIYNVTGTLIREICQNAIWGNEGFYLWDGTDMQGRKVRPGHYIIWIELFDLEGNVNQIKKTVVVGTYF